MKKEDLIFFAGKRILVTGHTGFKGSWLTRILLYAGAEVIGYSLEPEGESLYRLMDEKAEKGSLKSVIADIRDYDRLLAVMRETQPELVLHMAAQPIVRTSYEQPRYTYETNVMGTVNLCEAVRLTPSVKSFLNVTTDNVYKNEERGEAFREEEPLDGYDPYSNSKSCSELVTHSYVNSFFREMGIAASTARAGNVIGGGDFARDRIIPDSVRTALSGHSASSNEEASVIRVRNPYSIRPFQHVLEPLFMYLTILKEQTLRPELAGAYNIGPEDADCVTTGDLVTRFCTAWNRTGTGEELTWENVGNAGPHEATFLKLDCSLARKTFGWKPVWNIDRALEETVAWTRVYADSEDKEPGVRSEMIRAEMEREIEAFLEDTMSASSGVVLDKESHPERESSCFG
ncbi:MAG: CDP-glucose 4,6-dehydratase [Eubacterium sp.]|nr:CDP-glucose 4,6-dehydratase [Eubacterium sp.]